MLFNTEQTRDPSLWPSYLFILFAITLRGALFLCTWHLASSAMPFERVATNRSQSGNQSLMQLPLVKIFFGRKNFLFYGLISNTYIGFL